MEELVNKLAELQAERTANIDDMRNDRIIDGCKMKIANLSKELSEERDILHNLESAYGQADLAARINDTKDKLIDEWDEAGKTYKFTVGTLSFRTTKRLNIIDEVRLMRLLLEKTTIVDVVGKYIKGFKLMEVKKFVEVHNVQTGVAQIESETSVSLKTE